MKYLHNYGNLVPEHIQSGFENYLIHGLQPGHFLTSIIANDVFSAIRRADNINYIKIPDIAFWIDTNMPDNSYGSYDIIKNWCNDVDNVRTSYVTFLKENASSTIKK